MSQNTKECHAPGGKCIGGCRGSVMLGYTRSECPFPPSQKAARPMFPRWFVLLLVLSMIAAAVYII